LYLCEICGQEIEVLVSGVGTLVCCDEPIVPQQDEENDGGHEDDEE
jgi:superoxide reductase